MFGKFQQSQLRIEVEASAAAIRDSLVRPENLKKWLPAGNFVNSMPEELNPGLEFTRSLGVISIQHRVDVVNSDSLRLLLSQGIDGFHEWYWGDGWVQSRLEGVTALPLALGQTLSLLSLRQFLTSEKKSV
jgi:hypothetical protein